MVIVDLRSLSLPHNRNEVMTEITAAATGGYSLVLGGVPKHLWKLSNMLRESNSTAEVKLASLLTLEERTSIEPTMRRFGTAILLATPEELNHELDVGNPDRLFMLRVTRQAPTGTQNKTATTG